MSDAINLNSAHICIITMYVHKKKVVRKAEDHNHLPLLLTSVMIELCQVETFAVDT